MESRPPEYESELVFAVYDSRTGDIVHVHRTITLRGAEAAAPEREAALALELARRHGHRSDSLRVLAVDPSGPDPGLARRVDLERLELVTEEPKSEKRSAGAKRSASAASAAGRKRRAPKRTPP